MSKRLTLIAAAVCLAAGIAYAQYPIMDMVADKVIQKYQSATCEQLWEKKGQPKSAEEQRVDRPPEERPADASAFFNKVAASDRQQDVRMRDDSLMSTAPAADGVRDESNIVACRRRRALAFVAGVARRAATAQRADAAPRLPRRRRKAPAKAAKPAKKPAAPEFKMVLEPQGDGPAQGDERQARGGQVDVVHGDRRLRVSEQARAADRLHDALRRDDAAAGQAQDHHARRRPGVRVLLRRQVDDGLRAGRESGRGRRCAADDRGGAEGRVQHGRHLTFRSPICWSPIPMPR